MILAGKTEVLDCYQDAMKQDGVCVFKNHIAVEKIECIKKEVDKIRAFVMPRIQSLQRPLKTYSDIAERELGRLDYRCGFTADVFHEVEAPIIKLIKTLSPLIDFRHYWGAIPSLGGSGPTNLHRDVYPILNNMEGENLDTLDIRLPPYYFTVLIPLVEITPDNGPTEFIKGTHTQPVVDVSKEKIYAPLLSPGDFVVFDGRTLHRGSGNKTQEERTIAYITFVANWYFDQTFSENNYLFSELALRR